MRSIRKMFKFLVGLGIGFLAGEITAICVIYFGEDEENDEEF